MELLAKPAPLFGHELRDCRRARLRLGSRQHPRRRRDSRPSGWAPCRPPTGPTPPDDESRRALGRLPVPDRRARAGGRARHEEFAELLYGAVLRDWAAEGERMRRIAAHFDAASEIRIVGSGTDLRLSLEGRTMKVDALGANLPGASSSAARSRTRPRVRSRSATSRRSTGAARSRGIRLGSRVASSSTPRPRRTRTTCSRRSTPTRARAGSASSGSAAIPASPAT